MAVDPQRGDVWTANLDPTRGREQAGTRPVLVISANAFNSSRAELVIVLPITSKEKRVRSQVPIDPPEGGLKRRSFIKCEDVRSVAKERLSKRWGAVANATMDAVADRLRILMDL